MLLLRSKGVLTECHPSSRGVIVDPKGHPGKDGDQDRGHVGLQDEVAYIPLDAKAQRQPGIRAWMKGGKECGKDNAEEAGSEKKHAFMTRRTAISFGRMGRFISPTQCTPF